MEVKFGSTEKTSARTGEVFPSGSQNQLNSDYLDCLMYLHRQAIGAVIDDICFQRRADVPHRCVLPFRLQECYVQSPEGDSLRLVNHWWSSETTDKHFHFELMYTVVNPSRPTVSHILKLLNYHPERQRLDPQCIKLTCTRDETFGMFFIDYNRDKPAFIQLH